MLQEQANSESKLGDIQETEPQHHHSNNSSSNNYNDDDDHDDNINVNDDDDDSETEIIKSDTSSDPNVQSPPSPTRSPWSDGTPLMDEAEREREFEELETSLASGGDYGRKYLTLSSIGKGAFGFVKRGRLRGADRCEVRKLLYFHTFLLSKIRIYTKL